MFVEATGRTLIYRHLKVFEDLPYWPVSQLAVPAPLSTLSMPLTNTAPPDAVDIPAPKDQLVIPPPMVRPVALPVRKSLRCLVPKKMFPFELTGACAVHLSPSLSMSALISTAFKTTSLFYEPQIFNEAMSGAEGDLWRSAANHEMAAQTWNLVPLPPGRTSIPSYWDFKFKTGKLGLPCRRKARFFAKGYRQVKGVDYLDSFAPVVRYDSIHVVLAIAAARDLELIQLDVTTAFLNGLIDEVVYIAQPEGYVFTGREHEVCRLNKGIYGIFQASRIWNKTLHVALIDYGLVRSTADPCLYYNITLTSYLIIAVWVDDGLVAESYTLLLDAIVTFLNQKFEITAVSADLFVGIVITRNQARRQLYLFIPQFVEKILTKFQLDSSPPLSLSVRKGSPRLSTFASPSIPRISRRWLLFLSAKSWSVSCMRPSRCVLISPSWLDNYWLNIVKTLVWNTGKRVLRYLKATRNHGLCFGGYDSYNYVLVGYSDADYAGDPDTRRLTSGYVFILNGGAVTWSSRSQPIVALSTMQSEYHCC